MNEFDFDFFSGIGKGMSLLGGGFNGLFKSTLEVIDCLDDCFGNYFDNVITSVKAMVSGLDTRTLAQIARERDKALERSMRNNKTVKRYKHGRTQRTRVRRKR